MTDTRNAEGSQVADNYRHPGRSSLAITLSVWKALFLREAIGRLFSSRAAWFWLLFEPVFNVAYMLFIYTAIQVRAIGGTDIILWLMVGMLGFFMFRRTATQVENAISANQSLFAYRQVLPVDTALVRGGLEGLLVVAEASILFMGVAFLGHSVMPADLFKVLEAVFGLWLVGVGFGLTTSVVVELLPEVGKLIKLVMMPLYVASGGILPISSLPEPYRGWLMANPLAHGLEAARMGFAPYYHAAPETSVAYLYGFALTLVFLGLALHRRFAVKLVTQ